MNVLDTLLDLADLRYPLYQDDASLLSSAWRPRQRLVHTYAGLVDYDHGVNDARCHMVAGPAGPAGSAQAWQGTSH